MRKSVPAFICGLIGSLFSLWWGFISGVGGGLVDGIASSAGATLTAATVINLLGWLSFLGAIVGFVGSGYCFKKARKGAILLTITTVMCAPIQLYYFIKIVSGTTAMLPTIVIIFLLPVVLLIVATVLAFCAKEYAVATATQSNLQVQSQPQQTQNNSGNLEQELAKLKEMNEKGLITDAEYAEARKKVIDKHM